MSTLSMRRSRRHLALPLLSVLLCGLASPSWASPPTLEELAARLAALEAENRALKKKVARLEHAQGRAAPHAPADAAEGMAERTSADESRSTPDGSGQGVVRFNSPYTYDMLDPTTRINRKQLFLLEQRQAGAIANNSLTLGGAVTAIADYQSSTRAGKFGYLMRHPTSNNQSGKDVSEAVIHSAQLQLTGAVGRWVNGYVEMLYDPEQSFGAGTITALGRNQVQVRRGYVLIGNLEKSPVYVSIGKMATPFGLTDTLNPFTASTVWHAFGGLAYGLQLGYSRHGFDFELMAVQGGSQFRAANAPVNGTNIPSKLNNWVADASYTFDLGKDGNELLLGASYQRGSAYCQDFPVVHFTECEEANAAFDLYTKLDVGNATFLVEYAQTTDEWPGTFNPDLPMWSASKVQSFDIGGRYRATFKGKAVDFSADFSRFVAGPNGSPWEKQDQLVLGVAGYLKPNIKFFFEYIDVDGYAPLNFISGGNLDPGDTHSDVTASSNVIIFGVNAAF